MGFTGLPSHAPTVKPESLEGGPAKKVKLEAGATVAVVDDDVELVKLKEEEERMEEELLAAQRAAEAAQAAAQAAQAVTNMVRQRNERKAKIAALEARASATPERGGRS